MSIFISFSFFYSCLTCQHAVSYVDTASISTQHGITMHSAATFTTTNYVNYMQNSQQQFTSMHYFFYFDIPRSQGPLLYDIKKINYFYEEIRSNVYDFVHRRCVDLAGSL